jgi:hypothetical protein
MLDGRTSTEELYLGCFFRVLVSVLIRVGDGDVERPVDGG